jgi:hypothetical protein
MTGPAVHFLEASRPYRALGANAMLFFDPVLRGVFGGELASARSGGRCGDRAPVAARRAGRRRNRWDA